MPDLVAIEQFEGLASLRILESFQARGHIFGFHTAHAEQAPGGKQERIENDHLNGAVGLDFLEEGGFEAVEFLLLILGDMEIAA